MLRKVYQRLIFALDVSTLEEAEYWVGLLSSKVGVFKIGLELFVAEGPKIIDRLRDIGAQSIFLDLKFHDIPATMRAVVKVASKYGVEMLTCHCDQVDIFKDLDLGKTKLLGGTILTSLNEKDLLSMGYKGKFVDPVNLAIHRAKLSLNAGCDGLICSGLEVSNIREVLGKDVLLVSPGIRLFGSNNDSNDDQRRIVTPQMALKNGADYIVVGRSIRTAENPSVAVENVLESMELGIEK